MVMFKGSRLIFITILLFIIISSAFSMIIPVFNAPDEPFHFEYIRFLAQNKDLPNQTVEKQSISTEGFNPPLYYFIKAVFLSLLSPDKASDINIYKYDDLVYYFNNPSKGFRSEIYPPLNPEYIKWGQGRARNMFLTTKEDRFPFSGSIRLIHLLRIVSVLFGALTIFFIFQTAQLILPDNKHFSFLAASLCAFNPQFTFLSGTLNNDNLVILWATMSIWLLTKLMLSEDKVQKKMLIFLGIFIGLGLITKVNLSGIVIVIVMGIIYKSLLERPRRIKSVFINIVLFFIPILCIAGWFFARNISIFGIHDPLGWRLQAIQNPGLILSAQHRWIIFREVFFQRLFTSFWGVFDWLTIFLPYWAYLFYGLISLAGIGGAVYAFKRKDHPRKKKMCFFFYLSAILITLANLVILNFTFLSAQARLIFPALACMCIFMAMGIERAILFFSNRLKIKVQTFVYGFITLLICLDLYALIRVIYPVYR